MDAHVLVSPLIIVRVQKHVFVCVLGVLICLQIRIHIHVCTCVCVGIDVCTYVLVCVCCCTCLSAYVYVGTASIRLCVEYLRVAHKDVRLRLRSCVHM